MTNCQCITSPCPCDDPSFRLASRASVFDLPAFPYTRTPAPAADPAAAEISGYLPWLGVAAVAAIAWMMAR